MWKIILSILFFLIVIGLLISYWFFPKEIYLGVAGTDNPNFTLNAENSDFNSNASLKEEMQFYENMRYRSPLISYRIYDCPIGKKDEMRRTFSWIENKTILKFYEASENEEISITCEDNFVKGEVGAFVAGEGGVTNVTSTENFNVIFNGKIILIRESKCPEPLVGTHELLHALGFGHSENKNNIMYSTVSCRQTLGEDIPNKINEIYSFQTIPDLSFEDASASVRGVYLDVEVIIRNHGLKDAGNSKLIISREQKTIKEVDILGIPIGAGRIITLKNIFLIQPRISGIDLSINYSENELNKENNKISLEIKKGVISSD